jgi:hypothetical protein
VRLPAPFGTTDPQDLLPRVVDDVTALLDAVRTRVGLGPLPAITVPGLPADLPRGTELAENHLPGSGGLLRVVLAGLFARLTGGRRRHRRA